MILGFLQSALSFWDAVAVLLRAGVYVTTLGAAGLAMFAIGFGHRIPGVLATRLRSWTLLAVVLGVALSVAGLLARAAVLTEGDSFFEPATWSVMMSSRIGDSFYLTLAGLLLLGTSALPWRVAPALAAMGALLIGMSYAAIGHSTLYTPRQVLAAVVVAHLLAVAFWVGSLPPLAWVVKQGGQAAAELVEDWARVGQVVVAGLVLSGLVGAYYLVGRWDLLVTTWYGWAMLAKVSLVGVMFGFAAWHKLRLTPALRMGARGASDRLARSIWIEAAVAILVFYAAAELVSVSPANYGHMIMS